MTTIPIGTENGPPPAANNPPDSSPSNALPRLEKHGDVTVLTWNVLADCYLFPSRLNYLNEAYHKFETSRLPRLLSTIEASGADVICLQEVDQINQIQEGLTKMGYDVVFRRRGTYLQKTVNVDSFNEEDTAQNPSSGRGPGKKNRSKKERNSLVQFNNTQLYSALPDRDELYQSYVNYLQQAPVDSTVLLTHIITETARKWHNAIPAFLPFSQLHEPQPQSQPSSTNSNHDTAPTTTLITANHNSTTNSNTNSLLTNFPTPHEAFENVIPNPVDFSVLFDHLTVDKADSFRNGSLFEPDADGGDAAGMNFRCHPLLSGIIQHRPKQDGLLIAWKAKKFELSLLPLELDLNLLGYSTTYGAPTTTTTSTTAATSTPILASPKTPNTIAADEERQAHEKEFRAQIEGLRLQSHITPSSRKQHPVLAPPSFQDLNQVHVNSRLLRDNVALVVALNPIHYPDNGGQGIVDKSMTVIVGNSYFFYSPCHEDVKITQGLFTTRVLNQLQNYILNTHQPMMREQFLLEQQQQQQQQQPQKLATPTFESDEDRVTTIFCGDFNATPNSQAIRVLFGDVLPSIDSIDMSHSEYSSLLSDAYKTMSKSEEDVKEEKQKRFLKMKEKKLLEQLQTQSDNSRKGASSSSTNITSPMAPAATSETESGDPILWQSEIQDNGQSGGNLPASNHQPQSQSSSRPTIMKPDAKLGPTTALTAAAATATTTTTQSPFSPPSNSASASKLVNIPIATLGENGDVVVEELSVPKLAPGQDPHNVKLDIRLSLERTKAALKYQVDADNFIREISLGRFNSTSDSTAVAEPEMMKKSIITTPETTIAPTPTTTESNITLPLIWEYYLKYNDPTANGPFPSTTTTICTSGCPHHTSTNAAAPFSTSQLLPLPCSAPMPPISLVGDMIALVRTMRGLGTDVTQILVQPSVGFFPGAVHTLQPHIDHHRTTTRLEELKQSILEHPDNNAQDQIQAKAELAQLEQDLSQQQQTNPIKPFLGNVHFKISETDPNHAPKVYHQIILWSHQNKRIIVTASNALLVYWQSLLKIDNNDNQDDNDGPSQEDQFNTIFGQHNPYLAPAEHRHKYSIDELPLIVYLPPVQMSYFGDNDTEFYYPAQFKHVKAHLLKTTNATSPNPAIPIIPNSLPLIPQQFADLYRIKLDKYGRPIDPKRSITTHAQGDGSANINNGSIFDGEQRLQFQQQQQPEQEQQEQQEQQQKQQAQQLSIQDIFSPVHNPKPIKALYSRLLSMHNSSANVEQQAQKGEDSLSSVQTGTTTNGNGNTNVNDDPNHGIITARRREARNTGSAYGEAGFIELGKCNRQNMRFCAMMGIIQGGFNLNNILTRCTNCNSPLPVEKRGCAKPNHCMDGRNGAELYTGDDRCQEMRCTLCVEFFVGKWIQTLPSFFRTTYNIAKTHRMSLVYTYLYRCQINNTPPSTNAIEFVRCNDEIKSSHLQSLQAIDRYFLGKYTAPSTNQYEYNFDNIITLHNLDFNQFSPQVYDDDGKDTTTTTTTTTNPLHYNQNKLAIYIEAESAPQQSPPNLNITGISTRTVVFQWLVGALGPTSTMIAHIDYHSRYLPTNGKNLCFSASQPNSTLGMGHISRGWNDDLSKAHRNDESSSSSNNNELIQQVVAKFSHLGIEGQSDLDSTLSSPLQDATAPPTLQLKVNSSNEEDPANQKLRLQQRKEWRKQRKNNLEGVGEPSDTPLQMTNDDQNQVKPKKSYFISKSFSDDDADVNATNKTSAAIATHESQTSKPSKYVSTRPQPIQDSGQYCGDDDDNNDDDELVDGDDDDDEELDIFAVAPPLPDAPTTTRLYVFDGLYKLAKTLRTIGVDTAYGFPPEVAKASTTAKIQAVFQICRDEERLLVTNSKDILTRRGCPPYLLLPSSLPSGLALQTIEPKVELPELNPGGELSYKVSQKALTTTSSIAGPTTDGSSNTNTSTNTNNENNNLTDTQEPQPQQNDLLSQLLLDPSDPNCEPYKKAYDNITRGVLWSYQLNKGFVKMDPESSQKVESAYQVYLHNGESRERSKVWITPSPTRNYIIDLVNMTQRNAKTDYYRPLLRFDPTNAVGNPTNTGVGHSQSVVMNQKKVVLHDNRDAYSAHSISLSDYHLYLIKTHLNFQFVSSAMYIRCTLCNGSFTPLSINDVRKMSFLPSSIKSGRNKKDKTVLHFYQCNTCQQVYWWGSKSASVQNRLTVLLDGSTTLTASRSLSPQASLETNPSTTGQQSSTAVAEAKTKATTTTAQDPDGDGSDDIIIPLKSPQGLGGSGQNTTTTCDTATATDTGANTTTNPTTTTATDPTKINDGSWEVVVRAGRHIAVALLPKSVGDAMTAEERKKAVLRGELEKITQSKKQQTNKPLKTVEVIQQGGSIQTSLQHPLLFGLLINSACVTGGVNEEWNELSQLLEGFYTKQQQHNTNTTKKELPTLVGAKSYQDMISAKVFARTELPFISAFAFDRHDMGKLLEPLVPVIGPELDQSQFCDSFEHSSELLTKISTEFKYSILNPVVTNAVKDYQGCLDFICIAQTSIAQSTKAIKSPPPPQSTHTLENKNSNNNGSRHNTPQQPQLPQPILSAQQQTNPKFEFKWAVSLSSCGNGAIRGADRTELCPCTANCQYQISRLKAQYHYQQQYHNSNLPFDQLSSLDTIDNAVVDITSPCQIDNDCNRNDVIKTNNDNDNCHSDHSNSTQNYSIQSNPPSTPMASETSGFTSQTQTPAIHLTVVTDGHMIGIEEEGSCLMSPDLYPLSPQTPNTPSKFDLVPTLIMESQNLVICPYAMELLFRNIGDYEQYKAQINDMAYKKSHHLLNLAQFLFQQETNPHINITPPQMDTTPVDSQLAQITHPPYPNPCNPSDHCPVVASFNLL